MSKPKALLIAEKPSLMKTIKAVYEKNTDKIPYEIDFVAQVGHLLTLMTPDELGLQEDDKNNTKLPILPDEQGGWRYKVKDNVKDVFINIKSAIQSGKYEYVIHAGDPDREGQLLVDLVLKATDCDKYIKHRLRFWSNDLTDGEVLKALLNLEDGRNEKFIRLYEAGLVRQHTDYLFGMNGSSAARAKTWKRQAVGRVKTVVLKMTVDRENEIANFKPKTSYGVEVAYENGLVGNYFIPKQGDDNNENGEDTRIIYFDSEAEAKEFVKSLAKTPYGRVVSYEKKKTSSYAPELYKLSSLQVDASRLFGISPDETLALVQGMYDNGYLTYPRTGCALISSHTDFTKLIKSASVFSDIASFAKNINSSDIERVKKTKTYVNDVEMAKHGHSGLTPTDKAPNLNNLSLDERNIYELICKRFVAIFLPPLVQDKTTVITRVKNNNGEYCMFKSTGKMLVDRGYTILTGYNPVDNIIPEIGQGEKLNISKFDFTTRTTTCPKRFTDGTIIDAMENPGKYFSDQNVRNLHKKMALGTDATRSSILKTLIEKDEYIKVVQGKGKNAPKYLCPTEDGIELIKLLGTFDICKVDMTASWEDILEEVRTGQTSMEDAEKHFKEAVKKLVKDIQNIDDSTIFRNRHSKNTVCTCPCGGNIIATEKNYFCSRYKEGCKNSLFKSFMGTSFSTEDVRKLIQEKGVISKTLTKKDGSASWTQKLKYNFEEHKIDFVKK